MAFKMDRVGTPYLHFTGDNTNIWDLSDVNANTVGYGDPLPKVWVINAVPSVKIDKCHMLTTSALVNVNRGAHWGIAHQFTIPAPPAKKGQAVAVEITGSVSAVLPASSSLQGFFCRMSAATASSLAIYQIAEQPTYFAHQAPLLVASDANARRTIHYREVVVFHDISSTLPDPFIHGVTWADGNAAGGNCAQGKISARFALRTLEWEDRDTGLLRYDPVR